MSDMMDILQAMSDTAYENIKDSYEDVLEHLAEAQTDWDEREHVARSPEEDGDDAARSAEDDDKVNDKEYRPASNPYKKLMGQLYASITRYWSQFG